MSDNEINYGCKHYKRKCSLIAPCCDKPYICRLCHDEAENHELDRKLVVKIKCLKCNGYQIVQSSCEDCGIDFGEKYFCSICRLFDDVDKKQFHCEGCGICRIGGRENFTHCNTCGYCMGHENYKNHKCIQNVSRDICSICMESLHNSLSPFTMLNCGHLLHVRCQTDMYKKGLYTCPICNKSIIDMDHIWKELDQEIENTKMPAEYDQKMVWILCRDCHKETKTKFHVVGLKCMECGSYNTSGTDDRDANPIVISENISEEID